MCLGIDNWLFRNADWHICNKDCVHCVEKDCKEREVEYEETLGQDDTKKQML